MERTESQTSPVSHDLNSIVERLFDVLKDMDQSSRDVSLLGKGRLQWYGGSRHQAIVKNRWLREIRKRLRAENISTETNIPLPGGGSRCDLVIQCGSGKLWLKVLGVWKEYCRRIGMHRSYKSALFHPLLPNMEARTNSAANCISHLKKGSCGDGNHIGLLLVGFDSVAYPLDEEVQLLTKLSDLHEPDWTSHSASWSFQPDLRTATWMWLADA